MPNNDSASPDVWSQVRLSTRAGPFFEGHPVPPVGPPRARLFAFYLPQFHPFPENDLWWGPGFTEWRHVSSALPRFEGHIQPILPRDLGYYDLRDPQMLQTQVDLAQKAGISGFAFYYYFPQGQRIMRTPLDLFCQHIEFPFQLIWANHAFRRRWKGGNDKVLLGYNYDDAYDLQLIDDLALYMRHPCYETVQGRPLLTIYQIWDIPQAAERIARWRRLWHERHQLDPILLMSIWHDYKDPTVYGLDGAIEFPPHDYFQHLTPVKSQLNTFDPNFSGHYVAYRDLVQLSLSRLNAPFPLIKTVIPHWDNEARYPGTGRGLVGSTPALYQSWLSRVVEHAVHDPFMGCSPMVFINAWNEWGEGAVLEPSLHHGYAYANATARAVASPPSTIPTSPARELWVVLGMHRSGSSLLTRSLQVLGASLGDRLLGPLPENPKGFWEDTDILQTNMEVLRALGLGSMTPAHMGPEEIQLLWTSGFADRILSLIRSRINQFGLYALKEPRITQLLPFWQTLFQQLEFPVRILVSYRHPLSVAHSLVKRNHLTHIHSYLLWCRHYLNILNYLQDHPEPIAVVSYDQMLVEPTRQLERISTLFRAPIHTEELTIFCRDIVDPDLRHHPIPSGVIAEYIPPLAQEIHLAFTHLMADADALPSHNQLLAWQQQLDQLVSFFSETWESWQQERAKLQLANQQTSHELQELQRHHQALLGSRSWQWTRPLRLAGDLLRALRGRNRRPPG